MDKKDIQFDSLNRVGLLPSEDFEERVFYLLQKFVKHFLNAFEEKSRESSKLLPSKELKDSSVEAAATAAAAGTVLGLPYSSLIGSLATGILHHGSFADYLGTERLVSLVSGKGGVVARATDYGLPANENQKAVQKTINNLIELTSSFFRGKNTNREVKDLYFDSFNSVRKVLVAAAICIFKNFQIQFINACENANIDYVLQRISEDAVERFFDHYDQNSEMIGSPVDIVTRGVIKGISKFYQSFIFFKKVGVITLTSDGNPNHFYKRKHVKPKYGYRFLFNWESEVLYRENDEFEQVLTPEINFSFVLKPELWEEYSIKIFNSISKNDPDDQDYLKEQIEALLIEINKATREVEEQSKEIENLESITKQEIQKRKVWFGVRQPILSFKGRQNELKAIDDNIKSNIIVINGLSGIGKTELAIKYAYNYYDENDSVAWIDASSEPALIESFYELHYMLGWRKAKDSKSKVFDSSELIQNVFKSIDGEKIIFIYDNVVNFELVEWCVDLQWKSSREDIRVLITSAKGVELKHLKIQCLHNVPLEDFTKKEAEELIAETLELGKNDEDVHGLAMKLCYFPLAIMQSVFYIKENDKALRNFNEKFTIRDYLNMYDKKERKLLNNKTFAKFMGYNKTTLTQLEILLRDLAELNGDAKNLLDIMSYFAPNNIPPEVFQDKIIGFNPTELKDLFKLLEVHCVVRHKEGSLNAHGMVQRVNRLLLKKREKEILEKALKITSSYINLKNVELMLPHVVSLWYYAGVYNELIQNFIGDFENSNPQYIPYLHLICLGISFNIIKTFLNKMDEDEIKKISNLSDNIKNYKKPLYYASKNSDGRVRDLLLEKGAEEMTRSFLDPIKPNKMQFTKRERTSGINGHHCEIKLAMFFLLDGMIKKEKGEIKNFYIASNMAEAGDFDDVVYRYDYEEDGVLKTRIIFLQAKHKDNGENISKETLLSENRRNNFMLKKYMSSYWKIKEQFKTNKEPIFSNKIEDCELILYTNADYNFSGINDIVTKVEITENDLLNFKAKLYYKLKIENGRVIDQVLKILRNPMDFSALINELRFSVLQEHPNIKLGKQIIEDYQYPLSRIVFEQINPDEAKLKESFLNSDSDFAKSFLQEVIRTQGVNKKINLREIKLKVNPNFWNSEECPLKLSLPPKEFSDDDILKFAERLKIFTSQLNEKELTEEIKKMIQKNYDVEQQDIDSVYSEIRIKVTNWWQNQKKHNFLTEATKKIHKAIRKSVRFEIRECATPFVGRVEKLQELHRDLQNNGEILISQIATVTGLGGVGKSELARKYISDHAKDYDNNLIWIIAESYSTLVESFRKLAKQLKIETQDENGRQKDIMKIVKEVYKYFAERKRKSLFVFDNAGKFKTVEETDEGLDKFLPTGLNKPYVIITSRNQNWSENIAKIELNVFTLEEALKF